MSPLKVLRSCISNTVPIIEEEPFVMSWIMTKMWVVITKTIFQGSWDWRESKSFQIQRQKIIKEFIATKKKNQFWGKMIEKRIIKIIYLLELTWLWQGIRTIWIYFAQPKYFHYVWKAVRVYYARHISYGFQLDRRLGRGWFTSFGYAILFCCFNQLAMSMLFQLFQGQIWKDAWDSSTETYLELG